MAQLVKETNISELQFKKLYTPTTLKKALSMYSKGFTWKHVALELDLESEDAILLQENAPTNEHELSILLASLLQGYLGGLLTMAEVLNDANWVKKNPTEAIHISSHLLAAQKSFVRPQNHV